MGARVGLRLSEQLACVLLAVVGLSCWHLGEGVGDTGPFTSVHLRPRFSLWGCSGTQRWERLFARSWWVGRQVVVVLSLETPGLCPCGQPHCPCPHRTMLTQMKPPRDGHQGEVPLTLQGLS